VFARVTLLEIDTVRISISDSLELFEATVMPELKAQPGYLGVYGMATPEGKAVLVSFWETSEQAGSTDESEWYTSVLAEHTTLFRSPPGREHYEVLIAEPPARLVGDGPPAPHL
jgi:hypothetical protein